MQGNADVFAARDGICRKVDEILVEAEVSIINEEIGNTLALIIQRLYRETHSRLQHLVIRIIQLQSIVYVLIRERWYRGIRQRAGIPGSASP